jgi:DNA-binding CsgD family transcriptional regulator
MPHPFVEVPPVLDDERGIAALSSVVLQLHRGCRTWPAATFQNRALELLADVLPFERALWGSEAAATHRLVALHPYPAPEELFAQHLAQGMANHPLMAAARAAPGAAVSVDATASDVNAGHGLAMAQLEPVSKLRGFVCLWRPVEAGPYSPSELRLLQFVMPHLLETARESQLARGAEATEAAPARSHGVCDLQGALQHLDDRCQALLRLEWPQWPGGVLPGPLLAALEQAVAAHAAAAPADAQGGTSGHQAGNGAVFVGRRIAVRLAVSGRTALLAVRLRAPSDRLSARQRSIAELYASGLTGPEIAQRLGLAASTVNNHLGDVFKKLQVSNKLQLALTLKSVDA